MSWVGLQNFIPGKKQRADWVGGNVKAVGAQRGRLPELALKPKEDKQSLEGTLQAGGCPGSAG